jgi:TMEM175 potassium channel family protein
VATHDGSSRRRTTLGKGRMEAFSDGVLAFAITLLVIDIAIRPPGSPTEEFFHAWPSYLAYLVSFFTIGAAWLAHHGLTDELDRVDSIFLRLNLLFLLAIAFLPFPTRLLVEGLERTTAWQRLGVIVYGLTLLVIRFLFAALSAYALRNDLRKAGAADPDLDEARKKFYYAIGGYLLTIVIGLFVPKLAIFLFFAVAVFLAVPFRTVAREIFGKR